MNPTTPLPSYDEIVDTDVWQSGTPEQRLEMAGLVRDTMYSRVMTGEYGVPDENPEKPEVVNVEAPAEPGVPPNEPPAEPKARLKSGMKQGWDAAVQLAADGSPLPVWINENRKAVNPAVAHDIERTVDKLVATAGITDMEEAKKVAASLDAPQDPEQKIQQAFMSEMFKTFPEYVKSIAKRDFGMTDNDPNEGVLVDQLTERINDSLRDDKLDEAGYGMKGWLNWLESGKQLPDVEQRVGVDFEKTSEKVQSQLGDFETTPEFQIPPELNDYYKKAVRAMIPDSKAFNGQPVALVGGVVQFDIKNPAWGNPAEVEAAIDQLDIPQIQKDRAKESMNPVYEGLLNSELLMSDMRDWTDGLTGEKIPAYVNEKGDVDPSFHPIGLHVPIINNMIEGSGANTADQRKIMIRGQFEQGKSAKDVWKYYSDAYGVQQRGAVTNTVAAVGGSVMKFAASQAQAAEWLMGINRDVWANEINKVDNGFQVMRDRAVAAQIGAKAPYLSMDTPWGKLDIDTPDITDLAVQVAGARLAGATGGGLSAGVSNAKTGGYLLSKNAIGHSVASSTAYSAASGYASTYQQALGLKNADGSFRFNKEEANNFAMRSAVINGAVTAAVTHLTGFMVGTATNPKEFLKAYNGASGGLASKLGAGFSAAGFVGGAESSDFVKKSLRQIVRDSYASRGMVGGGGLAAVSKEVAKQTGDRAGSVFSRELARSAVKGLQDFTNVASKGALPAFVMEAGKRYLAETAEEGLEEVVEELGQTFLTQLSVVAGAMPQELNAEGWLPSAMTMVKSAVLGAIGGAQGATVGNAVDLYETVVKDTGFRKQVSENVKSGMKVLRELNWSEVANQAPIDAARQIAREEGVDYNLAGESQQAEFLKKANSRAGGVPLSRADKLAQAQLLQEVGTRLGQTDPNKRMTGIFSNIFKGTVMKRSEAQAGVEQGVAAGEFRRVTMPPADEESSVGFEIKVGRRGGKSTSAVSVQLHRDSGDRVPRSTVLERIFGDPAEGNFWSESFKDNKVKMADLNFRNLRDGRYQLFVGDQPTVRGYDPQSGAFYDLNPSVDAAKGMRTPAPGLRYFDPRALQVKSTVMNRTAIDNGAVFTTRDGASSVKLKSRKTPTGQTRWTISNDAGEVQANTSSTKAAIQWLHRNGYTSKNMAAFEEQAGDEAGAETPAITQISSFDKDEDGAFDRTKPKIMSELNSLPDGTVMSTERHTTRKKGNKYEVYLKIPSGELTQANFLASYALEDVASFVNGAKIETATEPEASEKGSSEPAPAKFTDGQRVRVTGGREGKRYVKDGVVMGPPNSDGYWVNVENQGATLVSEKDIEAVESPVAESSPPSSPKAKATKSERTPDELFSEDAPEAQSVPVGEPMLPQEIAEIEDFGSAIVDGEVLYTPYESSDVETINTRLDVGSYVMSPGRDLNGDPEMRYWQVSGKKVQADGTESYKVERINNIEEVREQMSKLLFDGRDGALRGLAESIQQGREIEDTDVDAAIELMLMSVLGTNTPDQLLHPDAPRDGRLVSYDVETRKIRVNRKALLGKMRSAMVPFRVGAELDENQREDFEQIASDIQNAFAFQLMEEVGHKKAFEIFDEEEMVGLAKAMAESESPFVTGYLWKMIEREHALRGVELPAGQDIKSVGNDMLLAAAHEVLLNFAMVNRTGMTVGTMHDNAARFFNMVNEEPKNITMFNRAMNRLLEMTRRYMTALKNWWGAQAMMRALPKDVLDAVAKLETVLANETNVGDFDFYNVRGRAIDKALQETQRIPDRRSDSYTPEFYEARATLRNIIETFKDRGLSMESIIEIVGDGDGVYLTIKPNIENLPYQDALRETLSVISANRELMDSVRDRYAALNEARTFLAGRQSGLPIEPGNSVEEVLTRITEAVSRASGVTLNSVARMDTALEQLFLDFMERMRNGQIGFHYFQSVVQRAADSYILGGSMKLRDVDPIKLGQLRNEALKRYYTVLFDAGRPVTGFNMDAVPGSNIAGLSEGEQLMGYPNGLPTDIETLRSDLAAIDARLLEINGTSDNQVPWSMTDPAGDFINFPPRDLVNFPQREADLVDAVNPELQAALIGRKQLLVGRINDVLVQTGEDERLLHGDYNPKFSMSSMMSPTLLEAMLDPEQGRAIYDRLRYAADLDLVQRRSNELYREVAHEVFGAPSPNRMMRQQYFTLDGEAAEGMAVDYFSENRGGNARVGNNPLPFNVTTNIFYHGYDLTTEEMAEEFSSEEFRSRPNTLDQMRTGRMISIPYSPDRQSVFALLPETMESQPTTRQDVERALAFSYEVFGLRANSYIPGPGGLGVVPTEAHYMMSQNVSSVVFNATNSMIDAFMQNDGTVTDLDMETMGFPLAIQTKVEEQEEGNSIVVNQHTAWPTELFKAPMLFDPEVENGPSAFEFGSLTPLKVEAIREMMLHAKTVMKALARGGRWFYDSDAGADDAFLAGDMREGFTGDTIYTAARLFTSKGLTPAGLAYSVAAPHLIRVSGMLANAEFWRSLASQAARSPVRVRGENEATLAQFKDALFRKENEDGTPAEDILLDLPPSLEQAFGPSKAPGEFSGFNPVKELNEALNQMRHALKHANFIMSTARHARINAQLDRFNNDVRTGRKDLPINPKLLGRLQFITDYQRMLATRFITAPKDAFVPDMVVPVSALSLHKALSQETGEMNDRFGMTSEEAIRPYDQRVMNSNDSAADLEEKARYKQAVEMQKVQQRQRNLMTLALMTLMGNDSMRVRNLLTNREFNQVETVFNEVTNQYESQITYHHEKLREWVLNELRPFVEAEQRIEGRVIEYMRPDGRLVKESLPANWYGDQGMVDGILAGDLNETSDPVLMDILNVRKTVQPEAPAKVVDTSYQPVDAPPVDSGEIQKLRNVESGLRNAAAQLAKIKTTLQAAESQEAIVGMLADFLRNGNTANSFPTFQYVMAQDPAARKFADTVANKYRQNRAALVDGSWLADAIDMAGMRVSILPKFADALVMMADDARTLIAEAERQNYPLSTPELAEPIAATRMGMQTPDRQFNELRAMVGNPDGVGLKTIFGTGGVRVFNEKALAEGGVSIEEANAMLDASGQIDPHAISMGLLDLVRGLPIITTTRQGWEMTAHFADNGTSVAAFLPGIDISMTDARTLVRQMLATAKRQKNDRHIPELRTAAGHLIENMRLLTGDYMTREKYTRKLYNLYAQRAFLAYEKATGSKPPREFRNKFLPAARQYAKLKTDERRQRIMDLLGDPSFGLSISTIQEMGKDGPVSPRAAEEILTHALFSKGFANAMRESWLPELTATDPADTAHPMAATLAKSLFSSTNSVGTFDPSNEEEVAAMRDVADNPSAIRSKAMQMRAELEERLGDDYEALFNDSFDLMLPGETNGFDVFGSSAFSSVFTRVEDDQEDMLNRMTRAFDPLVKMIEGIKVQEAPAFTKPKINDADLNLINEWNHRQKLTVAAETMGERIRQQSAQELSSAVRDGSLLVQDAINTARQLYELDENGNIKELIPVRIKGYDEQGKVMRFDPWDMLDNDYIQLENGERVPVGDGDFPTAKDHEFYDRGRRWKSDFAFAYFGLIRKLAGRTDLIREQAVNIDGKQEAAGFFVDISGDNLQKLLEAAGLNDDAIKWVIEDDAEIQTKPFPIVEKVMEKRVIDGKPVAVERTVKVYEQATKRAEAEQKAFLMRLLRNRKDVRTLQKQSDALEIMARELRRPINSPTDWSDMIKAMQDHGAAKDWDRLFGEQHGKARPFTMSIDEVYRILETNGYNSNGFVLNLADHILKNLDAYTHNKASVPLAVAFDEVGKTDALYATSLFNQNMIDFTFVRSVLRDFQKAEDLFRIESDIMGDALGREQAHALRRVKKVMQSGRTLRQLNERAVAGQLDNETQRVARERRLQRRRFDSAMRQMVPQLNKWKGIIRQMDVLSGHPAVQSLMANNPLLTANNRALRQRVQEMSPREFTAAVNQIQFVLNKVLKDPVQRLYGLISPGLRTALEGVEVGRSTVMAGNRFGEQVEQLREFDHPWAQGPYNTRIVISPDLIKRLVNIVSARHYQFPGAEADMEGMTTIDQYKELYPEQYANELAAYEGMDRRFGGEREAETVSTVFSRSNLQLAAAIAIESSLRLDSEKIAEGLSKASDDMMRAVDENTEAIKLYEDADEIAAELERRFIEGRAKSKDKFEPSLTMGGRIALHMFRARYMSDENLRAKLEADSAERHAQMQVERDKIQARNDGKPTRKMTSFDPDTGAQVSIVFEGDSYTKILALKNVMDSFYKNRWMPAYNLSKVAGLWAEGTDAANMAAHNASQLAIEANLTDVTMGGTSGRITDGVFMPDDAQERIQNAYRAARLPIPRRTADEIKASLAKHAVTGELASSEMFEPFTDSWFASVLTLGSKEYQARQQIAEERRTAVLDNVLANRGNDWMLRALAREDARANGRDPGPEDEITEVEDRMFLLTRRVIDDLVNYHAFMDMNPVAMNDPVMAEIGKMIGVASNKQGPGMAPDLHRMFKIYAELKGATIGDKILTTLAGGFVSTKNYKALAYFMEQNALIHRMFAKSVTAANEARDVLAWIENGIDGRTGREGFKTAEMNIHGMVEREARKVKGDKNFTAEELRSMAYMIGQIKGAMRPKLQGPKKGDLQSRARRLARLRKEWEHGMNGLSEAMQSEESLALRVTNWLRGKANMPPTYWESFRQKFLTNGFEVRANYHGSSRNYQIMDSFLEGLKLKQTGQSFDIALKTHLASFGISPEAVAQMNGYADTLLDTMSRLHDVYAGMARFSGEEIDTNPLPTRFKIINLGGKSMNTEETFANESLSENLLNVRRSLLEPSLEYQDGMIRAWDADGLRAPLRVVSDLLYRMNVAPSYEVVRHLVGEAEVVGSEFGVGGRLIQRDRGIKEPVFMEKARKLFGSYNPTDLEAAKASVNVLAAMVESELQYDRQVKQEGTLLEALAFRLGTFGMYQVLSSAWQVPRQTLPAFLAYSALRGNGKQAFGVFARYLKAGIRGRMSRLSGGRVADDPDTNFHDKVTRFVQQHSPYVFLRGPNGVNLAARTIDWSNPMGPKLADKMQDRMFADLLIGAGHYAGKAARSAGHAVDWVATENLDWFMARPEQAAVRSIYVSELYRLAKERGDGDLWESVDDMLVDGSYTPNISDLGKARSTSILIMAQSDSSKKGQIFHRGNNMWVNMLRSSLITFGNHLMTTAAHSHAGWSMLRHGDAATKGEGMNMIASSLAQNVVYGFLTYDLMVKMLSLGLGIFGVDDEDRKKLERAANFQWFEDNKWLSLMASFVGRSLTGTRGEFGYDVRADRATEEGTNRRLVNMTAKVGAELLGQTPFVGMLAATKPGQDINAAVWQGIVQWLAGSARPDYTLAGIKLKPLLQSDSALLNRVGSAIEATSGFLINKGDNAGYTGVGLSSLLKGGIYFANRRKGQNKDFEGYDAALTALYLISYLGTRDMRGAIEDEMRRHYDVQLYQGPSFPKKKGGSSGRGEGRSGGRSGGRKGGR